MDYCKFFSTEADAIAHCREVNLGRSSKDPDCCAVVDGAGDESGNPNYAVVNLETARELLADGESGLTCLIVTD